VETTRGSCNAEARGRAGTRRRAIFMLADAGGFLTGPGGEARDTKMRTRPESRVNAG
jgi:hypothetical protein